MNKLVTMAFSTRVITGMIVLAIACLLIGHQFSSFQTLYHNQADILRIQSINLSPKILQVIKRVDENVDILISKQAVDTRHMAKLIDTKLKVVTSRKGLEDSKPWKSIRLSKRIGIYGKDQCQKQEKIYFLKTSKTGSTTMANILMRFGFARPGTNFLMGESNNGAMFFLNGYMPFNEDVCFLGRDIPDRPRFDISYVHMKYNRTAIDRLMQLNTFKISILRDPLANFMSSWKYYNGLTKELRDKVNDDIVPKLDKEKPDFYKEMDQFLTKPWEYLESFSFGHSAYLFGVNPQMVFFGFPSHLLRTTENFGSNLVDNWLLQIDADFDHIIILEGKGDDSIDLA